MADALTALNASVTEAQRALLDEVLAYKLEHNSVDSHPRASRQARQARPVVSMFKAPQRERCLRGAAG